MMSFSKVRSVEKYKCLRFLVKRLHKFQSQCNVICANLDDASIDFADIMNKVKFLTKWKCGKTPQRLLAVRPCLQELSLRINNHIYKRFWRILFSLTTNFVVIDFINFPSILHDFEGVVWEGVISICHYEKVNTYLFTVEYILLLFTFRKLWHSRMKVVYFVYPT